MTEHYLQIDEVRQFAEELLSRKGKIIPVSLEAHILHTISRLPMLRFLRPPQSSYALAIRRLLRDENGTLQELTLASPVIPSQGEKVEVILTERIFYNTRRPLFPVADLSLRVGQGVSDLAEVRETFYSGLNTRTPEYQLTRPLFDGELGKFRSRLEALQTL